MADTPRRLLLRVTLKLLTLIALLIILVALFTGKDEEEQTSSQAPTLQLALGSLKPALPRRIEWRGGPLQLLRMQEGGSLHLFYDRGGNLGCPLAWHPPGTAGAPQHPWPGGFSDQCSNTWYRHDGTVLPNQGVSHNLQTPPHRLLPGNLLEIGVNGDNAAPAESP